MEAEIHKSSEEGKTESNVRVEIDTSAPFESVKEAVTRFGGVGYWKPAQHKLSHSQSQNGVEEIGITQVEEQAALLEKDLILKERETLDVLKELEATKLMVEELKSKLQKQQSEVNTEVESVSDVKIVNLPVDEENKENHGNLEDGDIQNLVEGFSPCPSSNVNPPLILMELKQAKLNLSRTTNDLADIRASVDSLNKKLDKERASLEKTRERLALNSPKISTLEEELNQTKLKLQLAKDAGNDGDSDERLKFSRQLERLHAQTEKFKKMGEAAKEEVLRALSEIEYTKAKIKTAEIRLVAAKKMKQAATAAEAVAIAEIKALSKYENPSGESVENADGVTLTFEEYSSLTRKAREAEELSNRKVLDAMLQVDKANDSKMQIMKRVEEATEEVKTTKKALEEALNRVEAANKGKLAVEEALRKWRSERGHKKRSVHNSTKFKNVCYSSSSRRDPRLLDANGINIVCDDITAPTLKPTLSIGQILSRKLLLPENFETQMLEERGLMKRKMSLGQMLGKKNGNVNVAVDQRKAERENYYKQLPGKRKKFGFARFSLLLAKQNKKKKRMTPNLE